MNDCAQFKDGDHEKGSDKGLMEEPIGQNPSQARTHGQNGGDKSSESEITGYPLTAPESVEQRILIPNHKDET